MQKAEAAEYAAVIAQVVPVLLLAAMAVPLKVGQERLSTAQAFRDVLLTGFLVGAATIAEFAALFGVWQGGLTRADTRLISWLLVITAVLAVVRVMTPVARAYGGHAGIPPKRVGGLLAGVAAVSAIGLLLVFNSLTR